MPRARRPRARWQPVFGAGKVHYEIGARINAMSYGGIGAMRRLASKLGLVREIDARLKVLKRHLPYFESDHVLNMAFNVLCGGTRLQDLGSLRNNAAYMDALGAETIPSPTAAGDFTRRYGEADVIGLMESINAVRPQLWRGRARDLLAAGGLRGCGRDAGADAGREEGGHGHVLQGGVGLPPAGRLAGQHG